jgi:hypothetical protein
MLSLYPVNAISEQDLNEFTVTIRPSGIYEDCFEIGPGDVLEYSFEASRKVNFNIHYHEDSNIIYGIERIEVTNDKGQFHPKVKQHHCMMWTNPNKEEGSSLTYSYRIKKR